MEVVTCYEARENLSVYVEIEIKIDMKLIDC